MIRTVERISILGTLENVGTLGLSLEIQIWSRKRFQGISNPLKTLIAINRLPKLV